MTVIVDLNMMDFWIYNNYIWIAIISFHFSLAVTKSSWNRQSTWNHSYWPLCYRTTWSSQHYIVVLVNLAASLKNSFLLSVLWWFVIIADGHKSCTLIWGHNSSRVACISKPNIIIYYKHYECARSWLITYLS